MRYRMSRLPALLALTMAVVLLAVSPRALFARDPNAPRSHARRPRPSRHVLPERAFQVAQSSKARWRRVLPKEDPADPHRSTPRLASSLPARAVIALAAPDYLRLFKDPHRQT